MDILRFNYLESSLLTFIQWAALCQGLVYAENVIRLGEKFHTLKNSRIVVSCRQEGSSRSNTVDVVFERSSYSE